MAQLFNQLLFIHKQALKDLTRSLQKKITIFITIFISVFILFLISSLNQSLLKEIRSNTKTILGGDAEIELQNQQMDDDIVKEINTFAKLSLNTTIASMVANKKLNPPKTSFVQLRAIDDLYPLYGEFITTKGKVGSDFFNSSEFAIINENLAKFSLMMANSLLLKKSDPTFPFVVMNSPYKGYKSSIARSCTKDVLGGFNFLLATMEAIVVFNESFAKVFISLTISSSIC